MGDFIKKISLVIVSFLIILGSLSFIFDKTENDPGDNENYESQYFNNKNISDGPYIFYENNNIIVRWIKNGRLVERKVADDNYYMIKRNFGFDFDPKWAKNNYYNNVNYKQDYEDVENLIAISDIHGQYDVLVKLLKQYKVIDNKYNWSFGDGHLVVLGDILDRGPNVTESLWLIYRLEKQANKAGGKVHVLLGNHELMVLNNDLRYIHPKYIKTAQLMGTTYYQLYTKNTFIGRWLRTKPVIVTINDMLFVHAGISPEFVVWKFTPEKANKLFINNIVGHNWNTILENKDLTFLMSNDGPIWYRGYFESPNLNEQKVQEILNHFSSNHIIVGHTSLPNVISLFDGKIFGIDSSIKYGEYGEILFYKKGQFARGTLHGSIISF